MKVKKVAILLVNGGTLLLDTPEKAIVKALDGSYAVIDKFGKVLWSTTNPLLK